MTPIPWNALFCGGRRRRAVAILAAAVLLSTCSLFGGDEEKAAAEAAPKAAPKAVAKVQPSKRVCPGLAVLRDAATITKFRPGGGRGEADIIYQGEITDARISCLHDLRKHKLTGNFMTDLLARSAPPPVGTMKMEITVIMRATNGPAAGPGPIKLPYFVSVTDAEKNVLNKGAFEAAVDFPKPRSRRLVTDAPIKLEIPIAKGQTGGEYGIFIGYQLTREELLYNRSGQTIILR